MASLLLLAVFMMACNDSALMDVRLDASRAPDTESIDASGAPDPDASVVDAGSSLDVGVALEMGPCLGTKPQGWVHTVDTVAWGLDRYIEYRPGDLPIVISAPHGGHVRPSDIPAQEGVLRSDGNSQEYARQVAYHIARKTGRMPHLIVNHLGRNLLNANRPRDGAAMGNAKAEQGWDEFHAFIDGAKDWITSRCGKGHYFDFHTNGHSEAWVEMGLALKASDLALDDAALDSELNRNKSTLRALANTASVSFTEIVRGDTSIGGLLGAAGVKAVPSPQHPDAAGGGYFNGGYNVRRHGSREGGTIDGTQIETHYSLIRGSVRDDYSSKLAEAIIVYLETHYGFDLRKPDWSPVANRFCEAAEELTLINGSVNVNATTFGVANEFGASVRCNAPGALEGPQLYYRIELEAGVSYAITLTPNYSARMYLFRGACDGASIEQSCNALGVAAALTRGGRTRREVFTPAETGAYTIGVDSRSNQRFGHFSLSVDRQ